MPGSSLEEVLLSETTPLVEEISVSGTQADADDGEVKSKLSSVTDETVHVSVKASEERVKCSIHNYIIIISGISAYL